MPGQENQLGQQESGRARRSATASPVLTRQDRPSSSGLQPAATRSDGTGASATKLKDRTTSAVAPQGRATGVNIGTGAIGSRATAEHIHTPAASGAALGRTVNGSQTSTGVDSDGGDQIRTPEEDSVSEMAAAGSTTSSELRFSNRGGPEAKRWPRREQRL